MARKLDRYRESARMALEPWIVEAALAAWAIGGSHRTNSGSSFAQPERRRKCAGPTGGRRSRLAAQPQRALPTDMHLGLLFCDGPLHSARCARLAGAESGRALVCVNRDEHGSGRLSVGRHLSRTSERSRGTLPAGQRGLAKALFVGVEWRSVCRILLAKAIVAYIFAGGFVGLPATAAPITFLCAALELEPRGVADLRNAVA